MFGLIPFRTHNIKEAGGTFADFISDFFNDDFFSPMGMLDGMGKFSADVRETDNEYLVSAELPGVNKEDIKLDYKDNNLIIRARRQEVHDDSRDSYIRKERSYGEFSRAFYLDNVNKEEFTYDVSIQNNTSANVIVKKGKDGKNLMKDSKSTIISGEKLKKSVKENVYYYISVDNINKVKSKEKILFKIVS